MANEQTQIHDNDTYTHRYRKVVDCDNLHAKTVITENCKILHNGLRRQITIVSTFISIIITCLVWSIYTSYMADVEAKESQYQLEIHNARQTEVEKNLVESLIRIEKNTTDLRTEMKEQRILIENIYKNGTDRTIIQ